MAARESAERLHRHDVRAALRRAMFGVSLLLISTAPARGLFLRHFHSIHVYDTLTLVPHACENSHAHMLPNKLSDRGKPRRGPVAGEVAWPASQRAMAARS